MLSHGTSGGPIPLGSNRKGLSIRKTLFTLNRKRGIRMKRNLFMIFAVVVLALTVLVGCNADAGEKDDQEMTAFYSKAREAFRVASGVTLPVLGGIDLDSSLEAYALEMEQFDEVIKQGGGEMSFDLDKGGINDSVYIGFTNAIEMVFGVAIDVDHKEGYDIEIWKKGETYVTVKYKVNTIIYVIIS